MIMSVKHRSMWAIWLILFLALIAGLSVGGYFIYEHFKCKPKCKGKKCGDNGCKGNCGICPSGTTCNSNGTECVQNTWSVSDITNANTIKSKITTQTNGISKDDIDKYIGCIMIAIKKSYPTTKDFINDPNIIQNLTNIVLACKPSCKPACSKTEKCISDQSNNSMCVPNRWSKEFSKKIRGKFVSAGAPESIIDCVMTNLKAAYLNPQDYFSLSNDKGEEATMTIIQKCSVPSGPSGSSGPSGPSGTCNVPCSPPGQCFSDQSNNSICVPNNWRDDPTFSNNIATMIANKLSIKNQNILNCVMSKIIKKYPNPQDYISLTDSLAQSITTTILNNCNNPPNSPTNPNPKDGGESFADTCILNNSPGYGKCMPQTIESCAQKMCDSRYKSSQRDRQTCYDDAMNWADNKCVGNPDPGPGPVNQQKFSYCGRETPGSKCVCQHSDTQPAGQYQISSTCLGPCHEFDCKNNESYYGIH